LWFDEKTGIKTSNFTKFQSHTVLWFDEKTGIKTSCLISSNNTSMLWFDEKTGIKTSFYSPTWARLCCGLMKKRE